MALPLDSAYRSSSLRFTNRLNGKQILRDAKLRPFRKESVCVFWIQAFRKAVSSYHRDTVSTEERASKPGGEMNRSCALVSLVIAIVVFVAQPRANVFALDAASIREALDFGRTGRPQPYGLHFLNTEPMGFVYTPFVRLAMASRAARQHGQELSVENLPPALTDASVVVALQMAASVASNCQRSDFDRFMSTSNVFCLAPAHLACAVVPEGHRQPRGLIWPLWVSTDISKLTSFGASRPSPASLVVAAFPVESFKPGYTFYASSAPISSECGGFSGAGRIPPEEVAGWR